MTALDRTDARPRIATTLPSTWRGEFGSLLGLAWPLIVAQLAQMALFTTDVIMIGWLGPSYLAAGNLASSFFNLFLIGGFGLVGAVAPLVAQAIGARDTRSVRRTVRQGLWLALILAAILMPIFWNVRPILIALGQDPATAELSETFAHYALWLTPAALMLVVLRSFLSAKGDTRIILGITVMGVCVNAFTDYALIFGHFGFPRLELRGAGISTSLVNYVMLGLTFAYILTHRRHRRYHLLVRLWKPDWPRLLGVLRMGGPIGLMTMAEVGIFTVAALMMGWLGTAELAAHAVALQLAGLTFMVPLGLSQATTVRVGIAYGARDPQGIRKAGWMSLLLAALFMSSTCTLFLVAPHTLVGLFLDPTDPDNAAALAFAAAYLGIAALFQLFDGTQVVAASALRGLGDTAMPLIVAIIGYWGVGLPVAWFGGFVFGLHGVGIWLGLASGLAFVAVILTIRFALRERLGLVGASA